MVTTLAERELDDEVKGPHRWEEYADIEVGNGLLDAGASNFSLASCLSSPDLSLPLFQILALMPPCCLLRFPYVLNRLLNPSSWKLYRRLIDLIVHHFLKYKEGF